MRTVTCRLYPTDAQAAALRTRLDAANALYNDMLWQMYRAWAEQLPTPGPADRPTGETFALDDVRHRAEQAFGAFVSRRQDARVARQPPFRAREHCVSVTFDGWSACKGGRLDLPGVGTIAVHKRQVLPRCSGAVTVKRRGDTWQACFGVRETGQTRQASLELSQDDQEHPACAAHQEGQSSSVWPR